MSIDGRNQRNWYNKIARRNGGYRKTWSSTIEGESGEEAFRDLLFELLEPQMHVLDAGCGSGEFSLEVAGHVRQLTGLDFAENMINLARANAVDAGARNCSFVTASTRDLPFAPESFELIYSRRGPTSILLTPNLLRPGGWMLGVHSSGFEVIPERLQASGLDDIRLDEYEARELLPTFEDFTEYWSRMPGHPDYTHEEHREEIRALADEYRQGDRYAIPHKRIVWRARKPP